MDENFIKAIQISNEINLWIENEQKKMPYNINVIDELHANENAHSRILCKLLQYKDADNRYRILESLISYISLSFPETDFGNIKVCKPQITQELERIDLWVRDKEGNYAIIFENKIKGADDQDAQLYRYIEKTLKCNFKHEQIFVVYLPGDDHEPSENSWGEHKRRFENRYAKLSFGSDIIPWLKKDVLPNCVVKEDILISALKQYIDHLEGLYRKRPSQSNISIINNNNLKDIGIIDSQLCYQIPRISEYIGLLEETENYVRAYRDKSINNLMDQMFVPYLEKIANKYNFTIRPDKQNRQHDWLNTQWMGFSFRKNEWNTFEIGFEFQNYNMRDLGSGIRYIRNVKDKDNIMYPSYNRLSSLASSITNTCKSTMNWPIFWPHRALNWFDINVISSLINDDMDFAKFIEDDIQTYLNLIEQNHIEM